ncbi:hypothetical protein Acr_13g0001590 [Actinidia rufa]|uniref:Uncharacterized protein n=1 Tax=Actinidia rufa TaxID=165716 RepID=A0A7J0FJ79_9ERIC|nr:hypothetical protein Acr_13g0001590 [Actinidia rufa]
MTSIVNMKDESRGKPVQNAKTCPKQNYIASTEVELIGFVGCEVGHGIASYMIRLDASLGKMIIDPRHPTGKEGTEKQKKAEATAYARQHLEIRLPLGTELENDEARVEDLRRALPPQNLCQIQNSINAFFIQSLTRRDSHQRLFTREICAQTPNVVGLFADKWSHADARAREDLLAKVSKLRDELVSNFDDGDEIARILEANGVSLFDSYSDGSAFVELLKQLCSSPSLALDVFFNY